MKTLNQIEKAIKDEIEKLSFNADYENTEASNNNEAKILKAYEQYFDYDFEQDPDALDYFQKATYIEIWQYHIQVIIPKLKKLHNLNQYGNKIGVHTPVMSEAYY